MVRNQCVGCSHQVLGLASRYRLVLSKTSPRRSVNFDDFRFSGSVLGIFQGLLAVLVGWGLLDSQSLHGQVKYTPESPEVKEIVRKAVGNLTSTIPGITGEKIVAALAVSQAQKRYEDEINKDHPLIRSAIESILALLPDEVPEGITEQHMLRMKEVYIPALSCFLLAEVDKVRYRAQITRLVDEIQRRVRQDGAMNYMGQADDVGDTSQVQYAALALYVANQHGFRVAPDVAKRMLQWFVDSQQSSGSFHYHLRRSGNNWTPVASSQSSYPSIHAGGLGSVYLLADMLQLFPRKKQLAKVSVQEQYTDLPDTVTVYIPPIAGGEQESIGGDGPVVSFNMGALLSTTGSGNRVLQNGFSAKVEQWNFYYLYAVERYAWFREQADGKLSGGDIPRWYDLGVDYLKSIQLENGGFVKPEFITERAAVATSFAILFLVRSSEIISLPSAESELQGDIGFPEGVLEVRGGRVIGGSAEKDINAIFSMLKEKPTEDQLEAISNSLKMAIQEFNQMEGASRGEIKSFLRSLISAESFYQRKIAVKFLSAEQDLDNVPALLFALSDPEFEICLMAHDGLRLISRRIDNMPLSQETRLKSEDVYMIAGNSDRERMRAEYDTLKRQWTQWFLSIRPDAELLD